MFGTQKNKSKKRKKYTLNRYHIGIPAENLATDPAGVWLDPGVKPHVACKHVAAGK
jgi:hypothetical protein